MDGESLSFAQREYSWRPEGRDSLRPIQREAGKRGLLVQAARKLYETQGVSLTSIKAVCDEADITRELFYYYFDDKDALVEAVLDDYLVDFIESVALWDESRVIGKIPSELRKFVKMFRRCLVENDGRPRPMVRVLGELGIRDTFIATALCEMTRYSKDYVLPEYKKYHEVNVDYRCEMIYAAFCSLIGLLIINPNIPDDTLMTVFQQTLHLDMTPLD